MQTYINFLCTTRHIKTDSSRKIKLRWNHQKPSTEAQPFSKSSKHRRTFRGWSLLMERSKREAIIKEIKERANKRTSQLKGKGRPRCWALALGASYLRCSVYFTVSSTRSELATTSKSLFCLGFKRCQFQI